jgi:formate-nitrite transporter family protein
MKRHLTLIMILAGALAGALTGLVLFRSDLLRPRASAERAADLSKASPGAEPPHARGADVAPVTLEEFADFQCPPCGRFQPELKLIEAEYGPRLRVVFRHFPLPSHEHALEAARATEAAAAQGRFWQMHDLLFERQREWSGAEDVLGLFKGYAREAGLDVERFTRDMDAPGASSRILSDQQRGQSAGVTGTPTLFVNGFEIPAEAMTNQGIRAAINAALNGKGP